MKIQKGEFKGFYRLPLEYISSSDRITNVDNVFTRVKLAKKIKGFNKNYLPYIEGYYYVPYNPEIDIRKLLYALENLEMPSSGNIETFNREFGKIIVPQSYTPVYVDPCLYEWCKGKQKFRKKNNTTLTQVLLKYLYIFIFSFLISAIIYFSLMF